MGVPKPLECTERDAARFRARADLLVRSPGGCWLWPSKTDRYGNFYADGGRFQAHRMSYAVYLGPVRTDTLVLHKCDVRRCVNPEHLFLGSAQDNMRDAASKGRMATGNRHFAHRNPERTQGELNGNALLTEDAVRAIRAGVAAGRPRKELAAEFGVCKACVSHVVTRRAWRHI